MLSIFENIFSYHHYLAMSFMKFLKFSFFVTDFLKSSGQDVYKNSHLIDYTFQITNMRLPREGGEGGKLRGFGYVEFEDRNSLVEAISLLDIVSSVFL